jgi:catechol 2,3-dioxygenase-like lactoylglutathione lyase family enzyme
MVEKISAVTLRVANMRASVRFYKDVLGLEIIYGSLPAMCRGEAERRRQRDFDDG